MTIEAFKDAVAKGQGRAVLFLEGNDPAPYADAIVEACLVHQRYFPLMEDSRCHYLIALTNKAGITERVIQEALSSLGTIEESRSRKQVIHLLGKFARFGDVRAWDRLVELALTGDEESQDAISDVGVRGLKWLIENALDSLADDQTYRATDWLEAAEEVDGSKALKDLSQVVLAKITNLDDAREARYRKSCRPAKHKPQTIRESLQLLDSGQVYGLYLEQLSKTASDLQIIEVAEKLVTCQDWRVGRKLCKVFTVRPYPLDVSGLMARVYEEELGTAFLDTLGTIDSPEVRAFALSLLTETPMADGALGALLASFRPEETGAVETALEIAVGLDEDALHDFILDLVKVIKKMSEPDRPQFLMWIFDHSPCAFCRNSAVSMMVEGDCVPKTLIPELLWDSESDTREMAEKLALANKLS